MSFVSLVRQIARPIAWLAVVFACAACGGVQLDSLEGEPAAASQWTVPIAKRTHPAVDGCQRFIAAARRGDGAGMWSQLSMDTRKALTVRAKSAGLKGQDVLTLRKLPVEGALDKAKAFEPLNVFAVDAIATLQLLPTAGEAYVAQRLKIASKNGQQREVEMRFEGYAWTIHDPTLGGL